MTRDRKPTSPWRPPTRRAFVALLGFGAAAALAIDQRTRLLGEPSDDDRPRSTRNGTTRWIGHC